jgi:hypothetical protein
MPLRLLLAWIAGWIVYMIAMIMTVYDGFTSMILQPIMGAIFTSLGLFIVVIMGLPLLFPKVWKWWTKMWWISLIIIMLSIVAMFLSWLPENRIMVYNPEISSEIESFHPALSLGGWFGMLFGMAWTPLLSIRNAINLIQKLSGRSRSLTGEKPAG